MNSFKRQVIYLLLAFAMAAPSAQASYEPAPVKKNWNYRLPTTPLTLVNHSGRPGLRVALFGSDGITNYWFEPTTSTSPQYLGDIVPDLYDINIFAVINSANYFGTMICETYYEYTNYFFQFNIPLDSSCNLIEIY